MRVGFVCMKQLHTVYLVSLDQGLILWGPLELPISEVSTSEEEDEEEDDEEGTEGGVGGPGVLVRSPSCSSTSEWSPGWM